MGAHFDHIHRAGSHTPWTIPFHSCEFTETKRSSGGFQRRTVITLSAAFDERVESVKSVG